MACATDPRLGHKSAQGFGCEPKDLGCQCRVLGGGLPGLSGLEEAKVWKFGNKVKVKNTLIGARTRPGESD